VKKPLTETRKLAALTACSVSIAVSLTPMVFVARDFSRVAEYVVLGVQAVLFVLAFALASRAIARKRAEQL
jgi:hypothetical protein